MTSPVDETFYQDRIIIKELDDTYCFSINETPLADLMALHHRVTEPKYLRKRSYQAMWEIFDKYLFFRYIKRMYDCKQFYFEQVFPDLTSIGAGELPLVATWYSGEITLETSIDYSAIIKTDAELEQYKNRMFNGNEFDRYHFRRYRIEKGTVKEFEDYHEDRESLPF